MAALAGRYYMYRGTSSRLECTRRDAKSGYQFGKIQHLDVMEREDPRAETALFDLESESNAIVETNIESK